jgi:hypothetical protein
MIRLSRIIRSISEETSRDRDPLGGQVKRERGQVSSLSREMSLSSGSTSNREVRGERSDGFLGFNFPGPKEGPDVNLP